jgi:hypothetical protein
MSAQQGSAGQTVNAAVAWLNRVLGSRLPTLPFPGLAAVLTRLWSLIVPDPLPAPGDGLPWVIKIEGELPDVLPGTQVVLKDLSIQVASTTPPLASPHLIWPPAPPSPASPSLSPGSASCGGPPKPAPSNA